MHSVSHLVFLRQSAYKFLLRCHGLPELGLCTDSATGRLVQFVSDNEKDLISQSIDPLSLNYDISLSTVVNSSFAGLFWFSEDYSEVTDICGVQEFTKGDVLRGRSIYPEGFHGDVVQNPNKCPRGRVSLLDGRVKINVGLRCPDSVIGKVVDAFGLRGFGDRVSVTKGLHWDPK